MLGILEQQYVLVALLKDVLDRGLTVAIGAEHRLVPWQTALSCRPFPFACNDARLGHVFVGGAARMATAFEAVGTIRTVLGILEQQYVLVALLKDVLDKGLTVAIGAEHGLVPLADCSVVVAPYDVDGERAGTVGVLGPTRMHYDQTLAAVTVVSKRLSKALRDGGEGGGQDSWGAGESDHEQRNSSHG